MSVPDLKLSAPIGATGPALLAGRRPWLTAEMVPLYLAVFIYVLLPFLGNHLLADPDTYLHIAAGNWILAHHSVPSTDPFSSTMLNAPWIAHEWFAEVILAATYNAGGWAGVVALTAAATAASFFIFTRYLQTILSTVAALIGVIPSFVLLAPHMLARPHMLAMPVFVAWIVGLAQARRENRSPSYFLLPLMVVWANLHGGFVVGLALVGAFALEAVVAAPNWPQRRQEALQWAQFLFAATLASLVTPHGINGPLFALHLSSLTYALSVIMEWRATDFGSFQMLELWILALLAIGFGLRLRLPLVKLLILLGLIHLALVHRRNADLLAFVGPILLAEPVASAVRETAAPATRSSAPARYYAGGALAILLATGIMLWRGMTHDDPNIAPTHALAAAAEAKLAGPVFNMFGFGGYLIFSGIPPFIDGRIDMYGDSFVHEYIDAISAKDQALPDLLERYHIEWTLLQPQTTAVMWLDHSPSWQRVYTDANAVIHRRVEANPTAASVSSLQR